MLGCLSSSWWRWCSGSSTMDNSLAPLLSPLLQTTTYYVAPAAADWWKTSNILQHRLKDLSFLRKHCCSGLSVFIVILMNQRSFLRSHLSCITFGTVFLYFVPHLRSSPTVCSLSDCLPFNHRLFLLTGTPPAEWSCIGVISRVPGPWQIHPDNKSTRLKEASEALKHRC